jgi:prepilin-type N-terminal cleavage/methylation domain-containing protein
MPFSPQPKSIKLDRALVSPGFTLIELIVAIGVVAIIAGITLGSRQNYSRAVNLNNVAHEIALSIRQAQTYSVSSRGSSLGDPVDSFVYGVYFEKNNPQQFILYQNNNTNEAYQASDTPVETYQLPNRMEIDKICLIANYSQGDACGSGDNKVSVAFKRPDPSALFYKDGVSSTGDEAFLVELAGDEGARQTIITRSSGFISVE